MTAIAPVPNPLADLPAMPNWAPPVLAPGLLRSLGLTPRTPESDYQQSLDGGFTETFEDFCNRISTAVSC